MTTLERIALCVALNVPMSQLKPFAVERLMDLYHGHHPHYSALTHDKTECILECLPDYFQQRFYLCH